MYGNFEQDKDAKIYQTYDHYVSPTFDCFKESASVSLKTIDLQ